MIRHCVFIKFKSSIGKAERDAIYLDLAALKSRLPGARAFDFGGNVNPEGLGKGYEEGFILDLDDAAARDAYLVHPDHQAIGARIVEAAEGGPDGIFVFDLDVSAG